ncbi:MAG: tyrosine-type recombinase/integrase [Deltaproteobacteria bacterium]|nr:tyrosine-type recombinase/integrase [Candidatus Deferrimicrobium borealis]
MDCRCGRNREDCPGVHRYRSAPEVHRLLKECGNPRLKAVVTVAVHTGMRRGEILSLKWSQVDLRNGFILVEQTKTGERWEVPISGEVRKVLGGIVRRLDSKYVFEE